MPERRPEIFAKPKAALSDADDDANRDATDGEERGRLAVVWTPAPGYRGLGD